MARPVAHVLMHFGRHPHPLPPPEDRNVEFTPLPSPMQEAEANQALAEEHALQLEAARESGRLEGYEAARAEFAEELERERQSHQEELAAARQEWLCEEGERLRADASTALAEIEARLAQSLGNVLMPFVIDTLRRQMIAELVETISTLIGNNEAISIKIGGPADMLEILRVKLADVQANFTYEVGEGVDVSVRAEQTMIETQLSAWIARIAAEME